MGETSRKNGFVVFMRLFFVITAFVVMLSISVACDNPKSNTDEFLIGDDDFSVTFVLNNGDDNVVWHKGDDLPAPTKKDCEFLYWCKDEELTVKADFDFENLILEQNLTLYAKWKELIDLEGVVFADVTCVYDGEAHSVKVDESTLPDGATVTYDGENSFVNAGEYVVSATIKADGYKDLVISATLQITKAKLVGITFPKVEAEWDGNKHSAFIKYTGGEFPSEVKVTYYGNGQAEVGNHTVTAKFEVSDNYEPIADMTALLVIKEKYFNVTFDDEISNIISYKVAHGQTLSDIPDPTAKDGYSACWNVENFENILADVNVKAIYTPIEYTISFISDDSVVATKKYDVEKSVDFDNISKQHYVFNGWYADKNRSGESVSNLAIGNFGDKRFYAKWSAVEYFVTFHTYDGTNVESNTNCDERYKYTVESDSLTLGSPVKSNYTFGGWYVNENFEGEPVAMIVKGTSGNLDLYAKWIACEYSIAYDYRDGEICDNPTSYTVDSEDIILSASHKFGYDFVGWIDGAGKKVEVIRKGSSGDLILHAEWLPIEFSIVLNGANGSCPTTLTYTIEDETVTLPKIARAGYTFAGWFDENGNKYETVSGSTQKDVSLTAKWNVVSYTINYEYNGGTQVDNPTSYTVDSEDIILAASHKFGYDFVGWIDGEGNKAEVIRKGSSGNLILHAEWSSIEFSIVLNGANGSRPTTLTYTIEDKTVTLPQIARAGYTFAGWFDEDGNKCETVSGTTQKDVTLTAKWNVVSYAITYEYDGGTQVDNPTSYTIEDEIVLIAPEKDGYDFDGWFNGENKTEKIEKGSYGDITLTAHWTKRIIKSDFVIENGVLIGYTGVSLSITVHSSEAGQTVTSVAATAFDSVRASVTQIVIEEGVQSVERGAFDGMTTLKTLSLPSTISTLHRGMLKDCASLESLTIPFASFVIEQNMNNIVTDENAALSATAYDSTNLNCYAVGFTYLFGKPSNMTNEELTSKFESVAGYFKNINTDKVTLVDDKIEAYVPQSLKDLTVLGGDILMKNFANFNSLQYVVLQNVSNVGQKAFSKCVGLKEVTIESGNTTFGGAVFSSCSNMTIYVASQDQKTALDSQIQSLENVECAVASN